ADGGQWRPHWRCRALRAISGRWVPVGRRTAIARISLLLTLAIVSGCLSRKLVGTGDVPPIDLGAPALPCRDLAQPAGASPGPPRPDVYPSAVTTVLSPEAPGREISLRECIALALENGRTGDFYDVGGSGLATSTTGIQPQGPLSASSDSI